MNDTSTACDTIVDERYRRMDPVERMTIASSIFDTARAIVESSLPATLSRRERRMVFAQRRYANELLDAALQAYADWLDTKNSAQRAAKNEEFAPIPAAVLASN